MLDHFGRGDRAGPQAALQARALAARGRGSRRRTGRPRRSCRPLRSTGAAGIEIRSPFSIAIAPSGPLVTTSVGTLMLSSVERTLEVGPAGQLQRLILIGEQQVDPAAVDHPPEAFLAPGDAHAFAQGEGDLAARRMGDLDRLHHRRARLVRARTNSLRGTGSRPRRSARGRAPRRSARGSRRGRCSSSAAPSGVTRIRQRPVGGPPISGGVSNSTPSACMSCSKIRPSWSSATWPMKAACRPSRRPRPCYWPPTRPTSRAPRPSPHKARRPAPASAAASTPWADRARPETRRRSWR